MAETQTAERTETQTATETNPLPNMGARNPLEQRIEERLDRTAIAGQPVDMTLGGVRFSTMVEVMEFAKLMSLSGSAVPKFLRANAGGCLAICTRALRWGMDPFAVAEKSYQVNNRGEERIAFESQLVHAVVEARAPLIGRLRHEIIGENDDRRCKVWGTFKGERHPHVFTSEPLGKLREMKGRNDQGNVKGSPLWEAKPEVQLFYNASRDWARLYCPDVLLGVYTVDELTEQGFEVARDVSMPPLRPGLIERLSQNGGTTERGFSADHVAKTIGPGGAQTVAGEATEIAAGAEKEKPGTNLPADTRKGRVKPVSRARAAARRKGS